MSMEEKIDRILELQIKQSTDIALIKQSNDIHLRDYNDTKKSHYKMRDEFIGLKGKVLMIAAGIGTICTLGINWLYNTLIKN